MANKTPVMIKGIKCDNPNCDFSDMSVSYEDYESWLNKPCPKCGQNLLTDHDYNFCKQLFKFASAVGTFFSTSDDEEDNTTVNVHLDGTENITIEIE